MHTVPHDGLCLEELVEKCFKKRPPQTKQGMRLERATRVALSRRHLSVQHFLVDVRVYMFSSRGPRGNCDLPSSLKLYLLMTTFLAAEEERRREKRLVN